MRITLATSGGPGPTRVSLAERLHATRSLRAVGRKPHPASGASRQRCRGTLAVCRNLTPATSGVPHQRPDAHHRRPSSRRSRSRPLLQRSWEMFVPPTHPPHGLRDRAKLLHLVVGVLTDASLLFG